MYRGVKYEPKAPEISIVPGKAIGCYRGVELHEHLIVKH
ncbi:DUF4278 domain-containing protein [Leptothermofonsia sp. ETS-13]